MAMEINDLLNKIPKSLKNWDALRTRRYKADVAALAKAVISTTKEEKIKQCAINVERYFYDN
jgi:hypothetical protein